MFAIYSPEGLRFRDTLENLYTVRKTRASTDSRAGSQIAADESTRHPGNKRRNSREAMISGKAVQAYREMLHLIEGDHRQYVDGKLAADAMSVEVITTDPVSDIRRVAAGNADV